MPAKRAANLKLLDVIVDSELQGLDGSILEINRREHGSSFLVEARGGPLAQGWVRTYPQGELVELLPAEEEERLRQRQRQQTQQTLRDYRRAHPPPLGRRMSKAASGFSREWSAKRNNTRSVTVGVTMDFVEWLASGIATFLVLLVIVGALAAIVYAVTQ